MRQRETLSDEARLIVGLDWRIRVWQLLSLSATKRTDLFAAEADKVGEAEVL